MPRPSLHARPLRPPFRPNPRERRPRVGVVGADGKPLAPCHPARARALVRAGRAVLLRRRPPLIALRPAAPR